MYTEATQTKPVSTSSSCHPRSSHTRHVTVQPILHVSQSFTTTHNKPSVTIVTINTPFNLVKTHHISSRKLSVDSPHAHKSTHTALFALRRLLQKKSSANRNLTLLLILTGIIAQTAVERINLRLGCCVAHFFENQRKSSKIEVTCVVLCGTGCSGKV